MNAYPTLDLPVKSTRRVRRALRKGDAVALLSVGVRQRDHFTRVWPEPDDKVPAGFLLAMLPARLVALALLWGTSSPRRLAVPLVLATGLAVYVLLSRYGHDLHGLFASGR